MFAVKEGKRILFEKLLAKGADINVVTKDLRNVAHICAMYSDKDMLDAIIARNRELLRRPGGPHQQLPIHLACERHSKTAYYIVRRILEVFEHQALEKDGNGSLPIHLALKTSFLQPHQQLPIHLACERHSKTAYYIVRRILEVFEHQALEKDGNGSLPIHLALKNAVGRTALHEVAYLGDPNLLKIMFKLHANANVLDKDNYTALHVAVQSGKASVVETLLGSGADIHVRGGELGQTALHI
ncbi:ankyrin repeat protein, partial [Teladorsagia circumcincta]